MVSLRELYKEALDTESKDLVALITFLVLEKKEHSIDDSIECLNHYFKPNNKKRMNQLLIDFKNANGYQYKPSIYIAWFTEFDALVIKAKHPKQAYELAKLRGQQIRYMQPCQYDYEFANEMTAIDFLEQEKRDLAVVGSFGFMDI